LAAAQAKGTGMIAGSLWKMWFQELASNDFQENVCLACHTQINTCVEEYIT